MKKLGTLSLGLLVAGLLTAQTTATFEEFDLPPASFLNGSDGSGGFSSGQVFLPNDYNAEFNSWSGWALSNVTDNTTPGFTNQYSAITGGGYDGSETYAVTFASPRSTFLLEDQAAGGTVEGLYLTNNTYTYLSMLNGDTFAKRFGGETGDDPDFFLLTVRKYLDGVLGADSVAFYLADYRFEDNAQDYLVDEWTYLDLSSLGNADSLVFALTSSDVGQFGMNTPAYFCVDNVITTDGTVPVREEPVGGASPRIFPNPASDFITISWEGNGEGRLILSDAFGRIVKQMTALPGQHRLDLRDLPRGTYFLSWMGENGGGTKRIVKQ